MPDVPRQTARAGKQFAAAHYTAADASGNGDKDHIGYIAFQRLILRPAGLRVVNGNGRQIGKLFQRFDLTESGSNPPRLWIQRQQTAVANNSG